MYGFFQTGDAQADRASLRACLEQLQQLDKTPAWHEVLKHIKDIQDAARLSMGVKDITGEKAVKACTAFALCDELLTIVSRTEANVRQQIQSLDAGKLL